VTTLRNGYPKPFGTISVRFDKEKVGFPRLLGTIGTNGAWEEGHVPHGVPLLDVSLPCSSKVCLELVDGELGLNRGNNAIPSPWEGGPIDSLYAEGM
jgi:hypothetical protein